MGVYNGQLSLAFKANDPSNRVHLKIYDGQAWSRAEKMRVCTFNKPVLAPINGLLKMAFKANDASNRIYVESLNW